VSKKENDSLKNKNTCLAGFLLMCFVASNI